MECILQFKTTYKEDTHGLFIRLVNSSLMVNKIEAYIVDLLDLFQQWHSFASEVDLRGNLSSRSELGRKSLGWLARKKSLGWLASRRSRTWLCPPRSHLVGFNPIRSGGVYPEGRRRRAWRSAPWRLKDWTTEAERQHQKEQNLRRESAEDPGNGQKKPVPHGVIRRWLGKIRGHDGWHWGWVLNPYSHLQLAPNVGHDSPIGV